MGRLLRNRWLIGALLVVAIAVASGSMLLFQGRDDGSSEVSLQKVTTVPSTSSTSTTTTTTTTTTTSTTLPPAPPPTAAPPAPEPAPVQFAAPPPAPAPVCNGEVSAVISAMNADRAAGGLASLCGNAELASYAQSWAAWMAEHQSLTHQDLQGVLAGTSFSIVAENILSGSGGMSTGEMEAAWMASPPHRENIMNGVYTAAGVGMAYSSDGRVWVAVDFGG